jgi:uncharacterized OsmC-like protein
MVSIEIIYSGALRTEAKHLQSRSIIITDAPLDNMGKGEAFSPTDLLAASLGSCMLTIMGITAQSRSISIENTKVNITKIMASDPRRVSEVIIEIFMPNFNYTAGEKKVLEYAALNCPVAKSLHPDLIQNVVFHYKT